MSRCSAEPASTMQAISVAPLLSTSWYGFRNVSIVRGDLLHPVVSGNKLFKLMPIFEQLPPNADTTLISVGGRYSNHLHALAFVAHAHGLSSVGLVQGYPDQPLTPTLRDCQRWGMTFHWLNKDEYQQRYEPSFWQHWQTEYPHSQAILEGGWSAASIEGSQQWWAGIPADAEIVITAVGSGTTLAGLALSAPKHVKVIGVPVFKDPDGYDGLVRKLTEAGVSEDKYEIWRGYTGKKFGALSDSQKEFVDEFFQQTRIKLDPVYTAKVFHAVHSRLQEDKSLQSKRIAVLHTGGLQGNRK